MSAHSLCCDDCKGYQCSHWLRSGDLMYFNDVWNKSHTHGIPPHDVGADGAGGPRISIALLCAARDSPDAVCLLPKKIYSLTMAPRSPIAGKGGGGKGGSSKRISGKGSSGKGGGAKGIDEGGKGDGKGEGEGEVGWSTKDEQSAGGEIEHEEEEEKEALQVTTLEHEEEKEALQVTTLEDADTPD